MQMLLTLFAFLVTLLGQGIAQDVTIQPCASGCVTGVFNNAAAMGCGQNDNLCVCTKATDYSDGIRDCVNEACANQDAAAQLPLAQSYGVAQCQSASSAAGLLPSATASAEAAPSVSAESVESVPVSADGTIVPSAPTSQATQASQPTQQAAASASVSASSTTAPETTSAPTSSPTSAVQTEAVSADSISDGVLSAAAASESTSSTTSAVVESSTASADVSPSLDAATSAADQSDTAGAAAASASASADETNDDGSSSQSSGLSVAARAGIGAGAGVAVAIVAMLVFCMVMRRRNQNAKNAPRAPTMQISQPLPGSGRMYADNAQAEASRASLSQRFAPSPTHSMLSEPRAVSPSSPPYSPVAGSWSSQLDTNARRYEDMSPQTQPRTMI